MSVGLGTPLTSASGVMSCSGGVLLFCYPVGKVSAQLVKVAGPARLRKG
jgi:hypothetical protein